MVIEKPWRQAEIPLGGKVVVEGALGQAGVLQDVGDAGRLEAVAVDLAKGRFQQLVARHIGLVRGHGGSRYRPVCMCQVPANRHGRFPSRLAPRVRR